LILPNGRWLVPYGYCSPADSAERYLTAIERSPNAVRAYAVSLMWSCRC
jgi:hypothetical protein